MKSTEVRLNNWVFDELDTKVRQIEPLDFFSDTFKYLTPIPLDEQWLLNYGFEKVDDWGHYEISCSINDRDTVINVSLEDGVFVDIHTFNANEKYGSWLNTINKHVHQLQNLYHSLTGKELTLNE